MANIKITRGNIYLNIMNQEANDNNKSIFFQTFDNFNQIAKVKVLNVSVLDIPLVFF